MNTLRPNRLIDEVDEEIRDHIERRAEALRAEGLDRAEAERQARRAFGNVASLRDEGRDVRTWMALADALRDIRYAVRTLRRHPGVTFTIVSSLGLALGATGATYLVVNAALMRPLPVPDPHRLAILAAVEAGGAARGGGTRSLFSVPLFLELRDAARPVASLALFSPANRMEVQTTNDPTQPVEMASVQFVSEDAFDVLRVRPAAGRFFGHEDSRPDTSAAVVSWDFWQRRLGGDRAVIDRPLRLAGRLFRVVGVAPRGFFGVEPGVFVDVWRPAATFDPSALSARAFNWSHVLGRLTESSSRETLIARLQPIYAADRRSLSLIGSQQPTNQALTVSAAAQGVADAAIVFKTPLMILLAIATGLLLVACINSGNLLRARTVSREVEMSVRASLGAGRVRLFGLVAAEAVVLVLLAVALGAITTATAAPYLASLLAQGRNPLNLVLTLDLRTFVLPLAVAFSVALIFSLTPSCLAVMRSPRGVADGRGSTGRVGRAFVAAQVSIVFCLIACSVAFGATAARLFSVDPGFVSRNVTVLTIGAQQMIDIARVQQFQRELASVPDVEAVAVAWWAIFDGVRRADRILLSDGSASDRAEIFYRISPGYFRTLGTPILEGRDLSDADNEGVAQIPTIVNRAFARRYIDGASVIGREFTRADGARHRIVGLVADAHYADVRQPAEPIAYFPMKPPRWFALYVRSPLEPGAVASLARRSTAALGSRAQVTDVTTLDDLVGGTLHRERLLAEAAVTCAAVGIIAAAVGLFGFVHYSVASRRREMAVRAAVGASQFQLLRLVLSQILGPILLGLVGGLVLTTAFMRVARALLFGVQIVDPVVLSAATLLSITVALFASLLPATRAARIDPKVALNL